MDLGRGFLGKMGYVYCCWLQSQAIISCCAVVVAEQHVTVAPTKMKSQVQRSSAFPAGFFYFWTAPCPLRWNCASLCLHLLTNPCNWGSKVGQLGSVEERRHRARAMGDAEAVGLGRPAVDAEAATPGRPTTGERERRAWRRAVFGCVTWVVHTFLEKRISYAWSTKRSLFVKSFRDESNDSN